MGDDAWDVAEAYEAYIGRWSRPVAAEFVRLLPWRPGDAWCDVGCGTGALAHAVLAAAAPSRVLGVEPSAAFAAAADTGDPRLTVIAGTATSVPSPDDAFDHVVSALALNFVPDPRAAVAEMIRVARPGGTVAGYVWDYAEGMGLIRAFWDAAQCGRPRGRGAGRGRALPAVPPGPARRAAGPCRARRTGGGRGRGVDGVRRLRRSLAAVPRRAGPGAGLLRRPDRRGPRRAAAGARSGCPATEPGGSRSPPGPGRSAEPSPATEGPLMRILIVTAGSRGDVAPFTGLGQRLQQAGHQVALAAHGRFADLVRECGLEYRALPGDPVELVRARTAAPSPEAAQIGLRRVPRRAGRRRAGRRGRRHRPAAHRFRPGPAEPARRRGLRHPERRRLSRARASPPGSSRHPAGPSPGRSRPRTTSPRAARCSPGPAPSTPTSCGGCAPGSISPPPTDGGAEPAGRLADLPRLQPGRGPPARRLARDGARDRILVAGRPAGMAAPGAAGRLPRGRARRRCSSGSAA